MLLVLIKTSFVTSNPYKCLSDCQFPRSLHYSMQLVLLPTGDNLNFTKKNQNWLINSLMDPMISQILLETKVNASTNSDLDKLIRVPTNVS